MSAKLIWDNLIMYSLQIGLLVGVAAFVPTLLRLRLPRARLIYLQILLAACLLLPKVRPWRQAVVTDLVDVTTTIVMVSPANSAPSRTIPVTQVALGIVVLGAVIRLGWLAVGLWRLRHYRRHSRVWHSGLPAPCPTLLSEHVKSPVTFGFSRPVILLPARFPEMDPARRDVILCHELLHVERHDWLFTFAEELIRAVFWFHPAIWWLLGEIQLAREQAVDGAVVERTQARDEYVDALLAIAGAGIQPDLAPAPLFLRRRHLKHRVVSILKEVRMSRTRWISGLAAGLGFLAGACWFVTTTFPLAASPQVVKDAPGVTVDVAGAALMHRAPVAYPEAARRAGVQGVVSVEAKLDAGGNVVDARVLSGPDELRKAAITSLFGWHFAAGAAGATRVVNINFQLPADEPKGVPGGVIGGVSGGVVGGVPGGPAAEAKLRAAARKDVTGRKIASISVVGLSDQAGSELQAKLPVHEGDMLTPELLEKTAAAVRSYDEHLRFVAAPGANDGTALVITAQDYVPEVPQRIKIGGSMQQTKIIQQARPVYPAEAKAARVEGKVKLAAIIGKDGTVQRLEVISGDPLLVPSALEAVKQWVYEPTLLNGNPVEVQTEIDVNYTLMK
jgi:TonB family protein